MQNRQLFDRLMVPLITDAQKKIIASRSLSFIRHLLEYEEIYEPDILMFTATFTYNREVFDLCWAGLKDRVTDRGFLAVAAAHGRNAHFFRHVVKTIGGNEQVNRPLWVIISSIESGHVPCFNAAVEIAAPPAYMLPKMAERARICGNPAMVKRVREYARAA